MQVTHPKESDSFVVIGGEQAAKFQIAASAAAFKIMSDTLYRDKTRAVAREVICNGIDAHIDAGMPDEPVEVTLTDDELIVKDQGLGIPHDKIGEIYCTLFGSTKAGDKRATGGFGLGCKAPFSLTDHFTVTSANQGVKSIYAMVASDPEMDGCPSAKRMMKAPTYTSGLTVSISLAPGMRAKLERDIAEVAKEGGMAVRLNGRLIETPDFRGLREWGYGLIKGVPSKQGRKISVLYANVLYPLDAHPELDKAAGVLSALTTGHRDWVIYARPSTIGITPSREALSYDEETVAVLKRMLERAAHDVEIAYRRALPSVLDELVKKLKRHELTDWNDYRFRPNVPAGNFCGAEAVGRAVAIKRVGASEIDMRDLGRALARRFNDHARFLRRMGSKGGCGHYRLNAVLGIERSNYVMRRVARAVGLDALPSLYRRDRATGKLMSPRKPEAYRYDEREMPLKITIGANQRSFDKGVGYFLTTNKLSDAQVEGIKRRAKKLGIEIEEAPKPEPVERPKREKPKEMFGPPCPPRLRAFGDIVGSSDRSFGSQPELVVRRHWNGTQLFRPDAIYTAKHTTIGGSDGFVTPRMQRADLLSKLAKKVVGRVAIVSKREELDNPLLEGAPRIERVVLDRIKARVKRRKPYEGFYARLALFGMGKIDPKIASTFYTEIEFARKLAFLGRDMAHVVLRERFAENVDRDEAYELWILAHLLFNERHREAGHMDAAEAKLLAPLHTEFRTLAMTVEAVRFTEAPPWGRVEHLDLLAEGFGYREIQKLGDVQRADFIHLAEELGRRHDARKQKEITK